MERKTEKWESLKLEAQKFNPQEYCVVCEDMYIITPVTDVNEHIYFIDADQNLSTWDWYNGSPYGETPPHTRYDSTSSTILFPKDLANTVDTYVSLGWLSTEHSNAHESTSMKVKLLFFHQNYSHQSAQITLSSDNISSILTDPEGGNPAGVFAFNSGYQHVHS